MSTTRFLVVRARAHYNNHSKIVWGTVALVTVSLLLLATLLFLDVVPTDVTEVDSQNNSSVPVRGPIAPAAQPVSLAIPSVGITTSFTDVVGVNEAGEIEVPDSYDDVSYYGYGPTPGELGPAVVLGHVDSVTGPAVFYRLGQAEVGDMISILRADDTVAEFIITELERNNQSGFPTEQVYGNINHAGLRLVTCSGVFDRENQRYSHNLIVYAELVSIRDLRTGENMQDSR